MGERRHEQQDEDQAAVAVIETPVEERVPPALLAQYEAEKKELKAQEQALQDLQARRAAGERLTRDEQLDLRALAAMIDDTKQRLEPLAAQVKQAESRIGVTAAVTHHNAYVEPKQDWHRQLLSHLSQGVADLQSFPALDTAQKAPLAQLARADGRTFPVLDAGEVLQNILSRVPHSAVLRDGLLALMGRPITNGDLDAVMDVDSGTKPLSEGTVRRFLEGR
jgi:hypothetical protein